MAATMVWHDSAIRTTLDLAADVHEQSCSNAATHPRSRARGRLNPVFAMLLPHLCKHGRAPVAARRLQDALILCDRR